MLTHEERFQLAKDLCARLVAAYPEQILLGGVYGSTARGTDTPWSDLEMLFVVTDDCPALSQNVIYQTMALGYVVFRESELKRQLTTPSRGWPLLMGILDSLVVLHGDPGQIQTWLAMGQGVPLEEFHRVLEELLPGLVVESYGRILSCQYRAIHYDVGLAIAEMLFEMRDALCLLNKAWVKHDYYRGLVDSFEFPKVPDKYPYLVPALYVVRRFDEIVPLASRLIVNFWKLMETENIQFEHYVAVDEIPL